MKRLTPEDWKERYGLYHSNGDYFNEEFVNSKIDEIILKLAELEDKRESGELLELPCKVGDTVYMVSFDEIDKKQFPIYKIRQGRVFAIQIESDGIWLRVEFGILHCCRKSTDFLFSKAAAEARLKELQEEKMRV